MTGLGGSAEHVMVPCAKISRDAQVRHVLMHNVYQHWNVHRTYNDKAWETIQKGWLLPQYAENCSSVSRYTQAEQFRTTFLNNDGYLAFMH